MSRWCARSQSGDTSMSAAEAAVAEPARRTRAARVFFMGSLPGRAIFCARPLAASWYASSGPLGRGRALVRARACHPRRHRAMTYADLWPLDPVRRLPEPRLVRRLPDGDPRGAGRATRARLEREPVRFLVRDARALLDEARAALGAFVGADPDDLAFVPNATPGSTPSCAPSRSQPGDELLTTDHAYGACRNALDYVAARAGARVVVAPVPFPLAARTTSSRPFSPRVDAADAARAPRPRHEPHGARLPDRAARRRAVGARRRHAGRRRARARDGAARPGAPRRRVLHGERHKWLCAPKGAALLHVRRDRQEAFAPCRSATGSRARGDRSRFRDEFDWTGTDDPTPALTLPGRARVPRGPPAGRLAGVDGDEPGVGASRPGVFLERLGGAAACPYRDGGVDGGGFLPTPSKESPLFGLDREQLSDWLRARGVESWFPPSPSDGAMLVRLSAQLYNTEDEFVRLAGLLAEALRAG